jgi:hypothetical protein
VSNTISGCGDLTPVIGITGTPVIDPSTDTMFVVSYDDEGGNLVYRLHALNVLTGADKWPAIVISGSVPGTGVGSSGGNVSLNPNTNRQRVALLLENGKIYVAFSSFCDIGAYHGWIMSYSYSTTAFTLANAYADDPNGSDGGIWSGSGGGIGGDPSGNVYYISGNGTFDANTGGPDYGDSFVRLNGSLQVQDYFTPYNQLCLSQGDVDLGAGGPLVIPSANAVISAGKEGRPYVVSTTSMGKYTADPNLVCGGYLHDPVAFRRGVLDHGGLADLQRPDRRDAGADQLRHLRHRRRRVQGGGGAVHRGRPYQRDVHHPVLHRQGQRPGQRHRDSERMMT